MSDLTTPMPLSRRKKLKMKKILLLSDLKVLTEKIYCLDDYDAVKQLCEKISNALQDVNEVSTRMMRQLCPQNTREIIHMGKDVGNMQM